MSDTRRRSADARDRLLAAAMAVVRERGFADASVEALCARAGVTKGAFFHHFASKEALGVALAEHWSAVTGARFAAAPYHALADPLARVMAYLDLRAAMMAGPTEGFTCVAGTMVQEVFLTSPAIRAACAASIEATAAALEDDLQAAIELYGVRGTSAACLARHIQAVIQGGFILAKAGGGSAAAREAVVHLKRYFELLFKAAPSVERPSGPGAGAEPGPLSGRRNGAMTHGVVWYELMTTEQDAAQRFYGAVLPWTFAPAPAGGRDYRIITGPGGPVGGSMSLPPGAAAMGMAPGWFFYVSVEDADAAAAAVERAGGAIHIPGTDAPGAGRFAYVGDPQGASFYVMQTQGTGPATAHQAERPGHGAWHELHASDGEAAMTFYRGQFGWGEAGAVDMGAMGAYRLFSIDGAQAGGMMTDATASRPFWLVYFRVDGIDAAAARVTAAGGRIVQGPHEVPGGGWILVGTDPQGGTFALTGPKS